MCLGIHSLLCRLRIEKIYPLSRFEFNVMAFLCLIYARWRLGAYESRNGKHLDEQES
jgi:hypothetical protein